MPDAALAAEATQPLTASAAKQRFHFVDLFRGLLMAHMALDHVSLFFNAQKFGHEVAHGPMPVPADFWQFITRFTGVFVAPGFSFMAGFMIAVTSERRAGRGLDEGAITRRLLLRGLILIAAEALLLQVPALLLKITHRYGFEVLACLGVSMMIVAFIRRWPTAVLAPLALAILVLHPLIPAAPDAGPLAVVGRLLHDTRSMPYFAVLYPVIPWVAVMLLGFVTGRAFQRKPEAGRWIAAALVFAALFVLVRLRGGYGNAYPYDRVASYAFFTWAKYPPDLAWLTWSFMTIFAVLALLWRFQDSRALASRPAEFVATFGRTPFFFYLLHFELLGLAAIAVGKGPLWRVYAIWAGLLGLLWWPCRAYAAYKKRHPESMWKYL